MVTFLTGDIWNAKGTILVTTNNVVCSYGLVMGAGIALEAKKKYPWLPKEMKQYCGKDYYLVTFPWDDIGCIQTKRDWKKPSPPDLVKMSIDVLGSHAEVTLSTQYNIPLLGCGNGGLNPDEVRTWLSILPDNITVWSKR